MVESIGKIFSGFAELSGSLPVVVEKTLHTGGGWRGFHNYGRRSTSDFAEANVMWLVVLGGGMALAGGCWAARDARLREGIMGEMQGKVKRLLPARLTEFYD